MSQHDMNVANADGATVRSDINSALAALVGLSSGATAPTTTFAYMLWADTGTGLLKIRNAANSAWITVGTLASTNLGLLALSGAQMTGAIEFAGFADVASAATTDLGAVTSNNVRITGAVAITAFGTAAAGVVRFVRLQSTPTLTYNAVSLILPTAANIIGQANDCFMAVSLGAGSWIVLFYQRANGASLTQSGSSVSVQTGTTHSPSSSDSGKIFTYTNSAGCLVTLPVIQDGLNFSMINRCPTSTGIVTVVGSYFVGSGQFVKIQPIPGYNKVDITGVSSVWHTGPRKWITDPRTIVGGSTVDTHSHGLGVPPTGMQLFLRCVNSNQGWQPGQEFPMDQFSYDLAGTGGSGGIYWTAPNSVNVGFTRVGASDGMNPTTGNQATLTLTNFKARIVVSY